MIEFLLMLFICADAVLLVRQDRELFYGIFNLRACLALIVFLGILSLGGIFMQLVSVGQWPMVVLLSFFTFYLWQRHAFKQAWILKYPAAPVCENKLALASELFGIVLKWFAGMAVIAVAMKAGQRLFLPLQSDMAQMVAVSLGSSLWMMILIYFMVKRCRDLDYPAVLGLKRTRQPWHIIWLLPGLGGLGCAALAAVLTLTRSYQPKTPFYDLLSSTSSSWLLFAFFIVAVILAPFFEEVIFRGFFFYVINRLKGKKFTVICIAVIFAFLHYDQYWGDWIAIAAVTFLGFCLTLLRAWTGSSIASMVMHYSFNGGMTVIPLLVLFLSNPVYFDYQIRYNDLDARQKEQFLLESIHKFPKHAVSYNDLAWLYAEENEHLDQALDLVNQALTHDPHNYAFLDTKAEVLYKRGEYHQALDIARELIRRYPSDEYAKEQLEKYRQALEKDEGP